MTVPKPLYFATDADIYDLLEPEVKRFSNQRLVDLALKRGIVLSPATERSELIQYISMLPFSHPQLEELCDLIESAGRTQRSTSIRVNAEIKNDTVTDAIASLRQTRADKDEQWSVLKKDDHIEIAVEYTEFNHRKSSLRQRSVNEITLQVEPTEDGELTIRHTASTKGHEIAKELLKRIESDADAPLPTIPISLAGIADRGTRTSFWIKLIRETDGLTPVGVTKVGVCRDMDTTLFDVACDNDADDLDPDKDSDDDAVAVSLIRRAVFEGDEVLDSTEFQNTQSAFFVYKASWLALAVTGEKYEIEAEFRNSAAAHQFEYIFRGVYRRKPNGDFYKSPIRLLAGEMRQLSRILEESAHLITAQLFEEALVSAPVVVDLATPKA